MLWTRKASLSGTLGCLLLPLVIPTGTVPAQTLKLPAVTQVPPSVPYRWKSVAIRGGGFVSGLIFSTSTKGLVYARTDVGGTYRSDDAGDHWTALNDNLGRDESSYLGIESIALDPQDGSKLYIAAGMYSADWGGPAAIFRSSDKGKSFERTKMPFKMGGNDDGRGCGERLAVDPNLSSILLFGSRKAGLWKSSDSGVTWAHVDSFPIQAKVTGIGEKTGITFVLFDNSKGSKGSATQTIYAGAAQTDASLYRSDDAGNSWHLVPGVPKDLFPNHAVLSRGNAVYFSFVNNIGPNNITDGAIAKLTLSDGKWKDITPVKPDVPGQGKFGYGGLAIDAEHPDTLMVTTIDRWWPGDTIFRTTDGGKKWKDVVASAAYSAPGAPWIYWHKETTGGRGWMSSIEIDPFNSAKVMYTTGAGIWGSADITAADTGKPSHWGFPDEGIEETVPLALISPSEGAHLLSGVGDIGGFRHEDLRVSPKDGFFTDPQLSTTSSMDFAALFPAITVRVGYGGDKTSKGGYSLDNGVHWKPFAIEPPAGNGGGRIAISANGKTIVWTPNKGAPFWSADWGKTWNACLGLTEKMNVVSDRVNPAKFYSFNTETGRFFESLDGARNFAMRTEPVAAKSRYAVMAPTPGVEGDLWIGVGEKVYHSSDSGVTFVSLDGMTKVYQIGFGMSAPGHTEPVIFMDGLAASQEGIYRSMDSGLSWSRVDDADHQYGSHNAVIGDPRVFGRLYVATGGRGILYGDSMEQGNLTAPSAQKRKSGQ